MKNPRNGIIAVSIVISLLVLSVLPVGPPSTHSAISNFTEVNNIQSDIPIDPIPVSRITFVSQNPDSYIDDFAYMAAVPSSVFYYGGSKY
ncbi:MAG: hypothetical protein ACXAEF_13480, partial [Candidatus Thorarchaeota archaeon]